MPKVLFSLRYRSLPTRRNPSLMVPRELSHAVVLALVTALDGARVISILPATLDVETPCLDGRPGAGRDLDIGPRRGDAKPVDPFQRRCIADGASIRTLVAKAG
jgi:hypothetical protein